MSSSKKSSSKNIGKKTHIIKQTNKQHRSISAKENYLFSLEQIFRIIKYVIRKYVIPIKLTSSQRDEGNK